MATNEAQPDPIRAIPDEAIYTLNEVAAHLRASRKWLLSKAQRREIPFFRVGKGAYRFTGEQVEQIRRALTEEPLASPNSLTTPKARPGRQAA